MAKGRTSLQRGLSDAGKALSTWRFWAVYTLAGLVIAAVAGAFAQQTTDSVLYQNVVPAAVGIGWLVMLIIGVVGWNAFRAPYRMLSEIGPTDDVARAIGGLSSGARGFLASNAGRLANGLTNLEIDAKVSGELTLAGIAEVLIVSVPDPYSGTASSMHKWKLTPFGKEVARMLREG